MINNKGKMEFDAAIMDHRTRYGAVMSLQDIKNPISVARHILGTIFISTYILVNENYSLLFYYKKNHQLIHLFLNT